MSRSRNEFSSHATVILRQGTSAWQRLGGDRVAERFYWRGMSKHAKDLVSLYHRYCHDNYNLLIVCLLQVKYCKECQKMNKKIATERPELHPVPVKSPWYHIGMDFVGPISPPSSTGNRYILTVSDYFTKFAWAKALPTKEAVPVVAALREVSVFC